jgi:hypothetical protein
LAENGQSLQNPAIESWQAKALNAISLWTFVWIYLHYYMASIDF